jgi:hypothetical protein
MALNAGSVNAAGVGTGLAKEAFDIHKAKLPAGIGPEALAGVADLFNSLAVAFVEHFKENAEIKTAIPTSQSGLQSYTTGGLYIPTEGPLIAVELEGTVE